MVQGVLLKQSCRYNYEIYCTSKEKHFVFWILNNHEIYERMKIYQSY